MNFEVCLQQLQVYITPDQLKLLQEHIQEFQKDVENIDNETLSESNIFSSALDPNRKLTTTNDANNNIGNEYNLEKKAVSSIDEQIGQSTQELHESTTSSKKSQSVRFYHY